VGPLDSSGTAAIPCGCPIALETQTIPLAGGCVDLAVTVRVDRATAVVGDPLTYTVDVRNGGPDTSPDVALADPLPPGLALVSSTGSSLGALGPGEAATATIVARATAPGEIANTVTASTSAVDLDPSNDSATATTHVDPAGVNTPPHQPAPRALPARWCSPSGDVCFGRLRGKGPVRLGLTLAARYFRHYSLCVTAPAGSTTCRRFRVHRAGRGTWGSVVRLATRFPNGGKGLYTAAWSSRSGPLGPAIGFRLLTG
jgi:uncharacterized repeat protein (TIGR01451 family)